MCQQCRYERDSFPRVKPVTTKSQRSAAGAQSADCVNIKTAKNRSDTQVLLIYSINAKLGGLPPSAPTSVSRFVMLIASGLFAHDDVKDDDFCASQRVNENANDAKHCAKVCKDKLRQALSCVTISDTHFHVVALSATSSGLDRRTAR